MYYGYLFYSQIAIHFPPRTVGLVTLWPKLDIRYQILATKETNNVQQTRGKKIDTYAIQTF